MVYLLDQKPMAIVFRPDPDILGTVLDAGADACVDISDPPKELLVTINKMFKLSA